LSDVGLVSGVEFREMKEGNVWYEEHELGQWGDVQGWLEDHYAKDDDASWRWVFRGEFYCREPRTKLEDAFDLYGVIDGDTKKEYEKEIIREFQRKASLHMHPEPHKDDVLEWLAVMQHHGAPTRLVDFTYSFYVALYFALARNEHGTIWAIHAITETQQIKERIRRSAPNFLSSNIKSCLDQPPTLDTIHKIKLTGDKQQRKKIVCELARMNISNASLFPDLDGFARSTAELLARPLNHLPHT
jgi:hypothetical protein